MTNKKVVLGVAAGVAALAVAGIICKRKGYFDNISTGSWGNKLSGLKDTAKQKLDSLMGHGSDNGSQTAGSATESSSSKSTSAKKGNSMNTGNAGMNPATT
jgi:hypothetical protein